MKIKFDNNSVSGVNRKYRGFVLDIPGHSSQIIDIPRQYVSDALSYLKYRHPAVICTPIIAEKPEGLLPVIEAATTDQQSVVVEEGETATEANVGTADAGNTETASVDTEGKTTTVAKVTEAKIKKSGGKK